MAVSAITASAAVLSREITITRNALGGLQKGLKRAGGWVIDVFNRLGESQRMAERARHAAHLHSMSDAELAKIGLKREEIVHRVFGPAFFS